jgi:hypothetical protein
MESAPVFVKVGKYKDVASVLDKIQARIDATSKMIDQLEQIKNQEDQQLQEWKESLDLIKSKLDSVGGAFQ